MGEVDKLSGKVTAEEVFFRALLNITQLSTNIYGTVTTDWQRNALNYEAAVTTLEALAGPFLDDEYFERVDQMRRLARAYYVRRKDGLSKRDLVKNGRDLEVKMTLKVANARLALIQDILHSKGIFFGKTYQAVPPAAADEGPGEGDAVPVYADEPVPGLDPLPDEEDEALDEQ